MKEIILESFKNLLNELGSINKIYTNKKSKKEELKIALKTADDLLFLNHSDFNVFYESVNEYICSGYKPYSHKIDSETAFALDVKKKIPEIEIKVIYNQLIKLVGTLTSNNLIDYNTAIKKDDQLGVEGVLISNITTLGKRVSKLHNTLDVSILSEAELKIKLGEYINVIISVINSVLLNDIYRLFEYRKINQKAVPKIFLYDPKPKDDYIQKWEDCKVTFEDVKRFKNIDYWGEIMEFGLSDEEINEIMIHHKKIFLSTVQKLVNDKIVRLKSLPNKIIIAERNFKLINKFFKGESTTEDKKRLKNIFKFNDFSNVLLSYDNVHDENLSFEDFTVFNSSNGEYSSIFVAAFFMFYLEGLKNILVEVSDLKDKQGDAVIIKKVDVEISIPEIPKLINFLKSDFNTMNTSKDKKETAEPLKKLDVEISVPDLALLFKMLNELKPKIFNSESSAELFRFISANFNTKKSPEDGISVKRLRNEFSKPSEKSIEFWEKHLRTMLANLKKIKTSE
jgi:hypothetical protein